MCSRDYSGSIGLLSVGVYCENMCSNFAKTYWPHVPQMHVFGYIYMHSIIQHLTHCTCFRSLYMMWRVKTVLGVYVCGEVLWRGVHGADIAHSDDRHRLLGVVRSLRTHLQPGIHRKGKERRGRSRGSLSSLWTYLWTPCYTPFTPHLHPIYTPSTSHLQSATPHLHPICTPFNLHHIYTIYTSTFKLIYRKLFIDIKPFFQPLFIRSLTLTLRTVVTSATCAGTHVPTPSNPRCGTLEGYTSRTCGHSLPCLSHSLLS